MTPTRNDERGVGNDSPAELFNEPLGTLNAGSIFPNFCRGVCDPLLLLLLLDDSRELERCNEFLALVKNDAALLTVLLLRLLSPPGLWSSFDFLPNGPLESEVLFSRTAAASSVSMVRAVGPMPEWGRVSAFSLVGLEEPPNILFSNPPWLERLLRLFPASLIAYPNHAQTRGRTKKRRETWDKRGKRGDRGRRKSRREVHWRNGGR